MYIVLVQQKKQMNKQQKSHPKLIKYPLIQYPELVQHFTSLNSVQALAPTYVMGFLKENRRIHSWYLLGFAAL